MKHFRRCAASNSYFRQKLDFKNFYGFHNWRPNGGLLIEKHVDGCWSWFSFKFWHLIMQTFCFLPCTMRFYWDWNCKLKECNEASKKSRSQPPHCEHQKPMNSISATSSRYNSATWKLQCNFSATEHFSFTLTRYFLWRMSQKIKRAKNIQTIFLVRSSVKQQKWTWKISHDRFASLRLFTDQAVVYNSRFFVERSDARWKWNNRKSEQTKSNFKVIKFLFFNSFGVELKSCCPLVFTSSRMICWINKNKTTRRGV